MTHRSYDVVVSLTSNELPKVRDLKVGDIAFVVEGGRFTDLVLMTNVGVVNLHNPSKCVLCPDTSHPINDKQVHKLDPGTEVKLVV